MHYMMARLASGSGNEFIGTLPKIMVNHQTTGNREPDSPRGSENAQASALQFQGGETANEIDSQRASEFILNKFKRLDRERKDWKKLAKSLFVVLSKQKGNKQKKLLEKYQQTKYKYRKSW